jgi:hypothetical protein
MLAGDREKFRSRKEPAFHETGIGIAEKFRYFLIFFFIEAKSANDFMLESVRVCFLKNIKMVL